MAEGKWINIKGWNESVWFELIDGYWYLRSFKPIPSMYIKFLFRIEGILNNDRYDTNLYDDVVINPLWSRRIWQ